MSIGARTYLWTVLLGKSGLVNSLLTRSGLAVEPVQLLFTEGAVFVGLLQLMTAGAAPHLSR